jgi:hypothetical protein
MTTTAGESIFVATYPETESKIGDSGDTKERDLESGGEEVVPVEVCSCSSMWVCPDEIGI